MKKFPDFLTKLDSITEKAKGMVVDGLIDVYKFQNLVQIIRRIGQAHDRYNFKAWEKASNALSERMMLEGRLSDEMTSFEPLK